MMYRSREKFTFKLKYSGPVTSILLVPYISLLALISDNTLIATTAQAGKLAVAY